MIAALRLVLAGSGNSALTQLLGYSGGGHAGGREVKYQLHDRRGFIVRLHATIGALAVAVGTDFALILAALHLCVFGAFGLDRHIAAVILADEVLESHVHTARITLETVRIIIIAD